MSEKEVSTPTPADLVRQAIALVMEHFSEINHLGCFTSDGLPKWDRLGELDAEVEGFTTIPTERVMDLLLEGDQAELMRLAELGKKAKQVCGLLSQARQTTAVQFAVAAGYVRPDAMH